jgi:hypothetical protein
MRTRRILLLLGLAVGLLTPTANEAVAADGPGGAVGIRLLDAPRSRSNDPRAHLYVVDHVNPGATLTRRVELSNRTSKPVRLSLYAAGADVQQGRFRFLDGRTPNELASWAAVQPAQVRLPPGTTAPATLTISVPPTAAAGERYAVVWAELATSGAAGGGVSAINRVGVRVYLSVGAGGEPPSDFIIESLAAQRAADGRPVVAAQVRNTGGRALDLSGELRLAGGPGGLRAGPFAAQLGTTLGLGETEPVLVPLDRAIPPGPWQARITLRSGWVRRTARATITFPANPGPPGAAVRATADAAWTGRTLLAIGAGVVVLGAGIFLLWRHRRGGNGGVRHMRHQVSR